MAEIKWIKITTSMFEDEKIDYIESLPEADAILIVWIKLLTLAGKCNAGGYVFLTQAIPYTDEMLAHKFRRPLNTVKLALATLERLEMIDWSDGGLRIANWGKHQNIEGMERIREQTRKRVARHRKNQKQLPSNVTSNATVTQSNATEEDIEEDIDIDQDSKTTTTVVEVFNQNIHPITPLEMEKLGDWLQELPEEVVVEAIKEAVSANVRKWAYINGILTNWKNEGIATIEGVRARKRDGRSGADGTSKRGVAGGSKKQNRDDENQYSEYDNV